MRSAAPGPVSVQHLIDSGRLVVGDGYRAKNDELASDGLPFARAQNIDAGFHFEGADRFPLAHLARVGNKVSRPGDVVFTSKGTVGRFALVDQATERFVYSPQLCFWRSLDPDYLDSKWLFYWMQSDNFYGQFKGVAGQTDMAEYVSLRDQRGMYVPVPPVEQQREVAKILGALNEKVELNRRTSETLEALAEALFQSWLVDFDPVRAKAEGVEDVFRLAGLDRPDLGVLSDAFLNNVRRLPEQNLAVELLRRLLNDEVRSRGSTNVVLEKKFSDRLLDVLNRYRSRAVESAEVIGELIRMAHDLRDEIGRGKRLNLSDSELAFYDALAAEPSVARELGDAVLQRIAVELTEKLRNSTLVDWQKRESVRARLRNLVRITLRRHRYPPEGQKAAIHLVLSQAERLSDTWTSDAA